MREMPIANFYYHLLFLRETVMKILQYISFYKINSLKSIVLILCLILSSCDKSEDKSILFHGGDILTMSENMSKMPEAVFVKNGKILSVGSKESVFQLKTVDTQVIDLEGKALLPGFIDVHSHPDLTAYLNSFLDLSGFANKTPEEVWSKLEAAAKKAEKGEWILAKGFDPILINGLKAPTLGYLDSIAPDNPVFIVAQSLHSAWVNTALFKEMGITANTPDPAPGSYYEKDENGKLTGFIAEIEAIKPMSQVIIKIIDIKKDVVEVLDDYTRNGITTISTLGLMGEDGKSLLMYEHLSTNHQSLKLKALEFAGLLPKKKPTVRHFVYLLDHAQDQLPETVENGDDFFKILGVKLWYDGSPYTGSMYLKEPYIESDLMQKSLKIPYNNSGKSIISPTELYSKVKKIHESGWQIAVHSQGDKASEEVMTAFQKAMAKSPERDHRHRLEHLLLFSTPQLNIVKKLDMTLSFHINHLYYYGKALREDIIGKERAELILPVNSAKNAGLIFSLHADFPMYPIEPFSLMQTAVTRRNKEDELIGHHEAISKMEALKSLTIYSAWQLHMEDKIGSIEKGKYADLVILDKNPLKVSSNNFRNISVVKTFINGNEIYSQ
jgi:predicted amidohydrolase YtcJ